MCQAQSLRLCCAFFLPEKAQVFLSLLATTRIYNGKTMPTLERSSKKLQVLHTAIELFNIYGFHNTGVDLIVKKSKIPKATFYNYFHSKQRLIEMCISFQKANSKKKYWQLFTQAVTEPQAINSKRLLFYMSILIACTIYYLKPFLKLNTFTLRPTV